MEDKIKVGKNAFGGGVYFPLLCFSFLAVDLPFSHLLFMDSKMIFPQNEWN